MNRYEMVNIIDVNWGEGDQSRAEEVIRQEITGAGGTVESIGGMGRRQLAYPIENHQEGLYLLTTFSHPAEGIASLQSRFKLHPAVIRTLIVRAPARVELEPEKKVSETAATDSKTVPPEGSAPSVESEITAAVPTEQAGPTEETEPDESSPKAEK